VTEGWGKPIHSALEYGPCVEPVTGLYPHRACYCCIPWWNRPYWAIP